jgi:cyclopropane-fatty-acyl-phospholipid synthase
MENVMQKILDWMGRGFTGGQLQFVAPDGRNWTLGHGTPQARILLRDAATLRHILFNPALRLGETYVDGRWQPEGGQLDAVLEVGMRFTQYCEDQHRGYWTEKLFAVLGELNNATSSRRNVAHHYDLDESLYRSFLDTDMQYSCAYFADGVRTLEQAQQAKCELIARKLDLRPGALVLDIGCGWGGLALYLARTRHVHVTGITLSQGQLEVAQRRLKASGLHRHVKFRLEDYRDTEGQFDAVVSVGMFEHVGRPQYATFFETVSRLLKDDGVALLHTIGRLSPPGVTNPWIRKYIFPGGYVPAASELFTAVENSGLKHSDFECWRLHYAKTLVEWQRRFAIARPLTAGRMGERFCRMWEFYLKASEASFRWGDLAVFHTQLTHRIDRAPLTRDYLYREAIAQAKAA